MRGVGESMGNRGQRRGIAPSRQRESTPVQILCTWRPVSDPLTTLEECKVFHISRRTYYQRVEEVKQREDSWGWEK